MPNRIAKRKAKLDRVRAGNAVFHEDSLIFNVEYHETSKYKRNKAKRKRKAIKLVQSSSENITSDGRKVAVRLNKQLLDVKPTIIKRKRASTKTTVVDGVTRVTKRHSIKYTHADVEAFRKRKLWQDAQNTQEGQRKRDPNSAGGWRS